MWRVRCECGAQIEVLGESLTSEHTRSCGCLSAEMSSARFTKHGEAKGERTIEFKAYLRMIARCCHANKYYSLRGVTVCPQWSADYESFLADVGRSPGPDYSLDRIDNNGDYAPGNVRWATRVEQQRNKRTNRKITHKGKTMCVAEWAEQSGIHSATIRGRLARGWTIEKALSEKAVR